MVVFLAIFKVWVDRQALNIDNFTDSSTELLQNDAIRSQVASYLSGGTSFEASTKGALAA